MHQVQARYWNLRNKKPADRRWIKSRKKRQQGITGDYLFDLGMDDTFLDGEDADVSGWCRFMNHAKESSKACNVETKYCVRECGSEDSDEDRMANEGLGSADETDATRPRLWFVATRDIESGEELSYDYGDSYWDP